MGGSTFSKKWGIGSLSLIISIFAIIFSFTFIDGKYIGEHILNGIGISFPIVIISLFLFLVSIFIGHKYKNDYLAKSGKVLAITFILLITIISIISSLF